MAIIYARRSGFTLIELLVVGSRIIAVLVRPLLPASKKFVKPRLA